MSISLQVMAVYGRIYITWFKWPNSDFFLPSGTDWIWPARVCKQEKAHGYWYFQNGFRPHSYLEMNLIWIRYVHLHLHVSGHIGYSPINESHTSLKSYCCKRHELRWTPTANGGQRLNPVVVLCNLSLWALELEKVGSTENSQSDERTY